KCGKDHTGACPKSLQMKKKQAPGYEEHQKKPGQQGVSAGAGTDVGAEEGQAKPGHTATGSEIPGEPGYEEAQPKPGGTTQSLVAHEKAAVGEAAGYLKELGEPTSQLDDEGRMKAYHYHKTLDGIGQVEDMA